MQVMTFEPPQSQDTAPETAPRTAPQVAPHPEDSSIFLPLDPRALRLWQVTDLLAFLVLLAVGLVVGAILVVKWPPLLAWVLGCWLGFALLGAWTILYYHPRNYRTWGFRLDHRVLMIRRGVWFRTIRLLPLPRLQHVDVKSGPFQRRFGLATLVLHTAGTHAAAIEVPGLDAHSATLLRDELVAAGGDDGV
jgi:membrane protein YdbS with pleckstrin-like domain